MEKPQFARQPKLFNFQDQTPASSRSAHVRVVPDTLERENDGLAGADERYLNGISANRAGQLDLLSS
jgi:hypothetical protein